MSRFSRSADAYLVWAPTVSGVRIEYAATLFREVRLESSMGAATGVLYGVRGTGDVRVVAARRTIDSDRPDARLAGLEKVGIFSVRAHGEVSLTASDREHLEKLESAAVALVIAGTQGSFFVRDADGAIQSMTSHQEAFAASPPIPAGMKPVSAQLAHALRRWVTLAATTLALTVVFLVARPHLRLS